ncbi:alpha/beta fold hydrolase [Saccharothrix stipae]
MGIPGPGLLAGGTTMLSWRDALCARLAAGGRRVVRYDLRDCEGSTTVDPEAPDYTLRDLAADAAALVTALGATTAHLGGSGVGGMVAQVAALDHPNVFSALTCRPPRLATNHRAFAPRPHRSRRSEPPRGTCPPAPAGTFDSLRRTLRCCG